MIIDSHTYCFKPANDIDGYENKEEHLNWIKDANKSHHQPLISLTDRTILSKTESNMKFDIDNKTGRVLWKTNGKLYTQYYYPPNLRNLEFTPHSLISEMDYAGIDIALLHTNPSLGRSNIYQSQCVKLYPKRILSMASVDEWLIEDNPESVIENVVYAIKELNLHAIKFNPLGYLKSNQPWDSGIYEYFWQTITKLNVPIFFTLGTGPNFKAQNFSNKDAVNGYLKELNILMKWMDKYPNNKCSITHGFPWRIFLENNHITLPKDIWAPFNNPNLYMEVCFPVRIGDIFEFPYVDIWPILDELINNIGFGNLHYGTDMPFQNRFCTYKQSRKWIENHYKNNTGMTQNELNMIMGKTAAKLLNIL